MTKDDIIRMAREALLPSCHLTHPKALERFAALVVAAERDRRWTQSHWTEYELSIVAAEREACAQVCDGWTNADGDRCAAAIRARGEK
jgi:hypothetical protein